MTVDEMIIALKKRRNKWHINDYGQIRNGNGHCPLQVLTRCTHGYSDVAQKMHLPVKEICWAADEKSRGHLKKLGATAIRRKLLTLVTKHSS